MSFWNKKTRLKIVIVTTTIMFFGEIIFGYITHSIALVTDAFHMLSDIIALCIAHKAISLSEKRTFTADYTYGWQRAETLGALVNAVFLLSLCFSIFLQAIQRFFQPVPITQPLTVLIVGGIGLAVNILGLFLFHDLHDHHHEHEHETSQDEVEPAPAEVTADITIVTSTSDAPGQAKNLKSQAGAMNMRGAYLHILGDAMGSVGVIISASIIQ